MNARQRNKVAMFKAVRKVFNDFLTELSVIPALPSQIEQFIQHTQKIDDVYLVQLGLANGNAHLKLKEEAEMIEATVEMAAAIYVYAQITNDPTLQAKCDVSPSSLERMSNEMLQASCTNIYNEAIKQNGNLTDYGKSPEDIAQLKKEIDDFTEIISNPRSSIVTRSQATGELKILIKDCNHLLTEKIDKLMLVIKSKSPRVYNTYSAARTIVDLRKGKTVTEEE